MVPAVGVRSVQYTKKTWHLETFGKHLWNPSTKPSMSWHVKSGETHLSVISILNVFWIYPERLLKPGGDQSESIMTCSQSTKDSTTPKRISSSFINYFVAWSSSNFYWHQGEMRGIGGSMELLCRYSRASERRSRWGGSWLSSSLDKRVVIEIPHLVWWFSIIFLWKPFRSSITHVQPMVLEYESQHLPHKSPSFVGKYTIHGAPSFFRFFQPATCLIPRGELVQNLGSDCLQGLIGTIPAW